MNDLFIYGNNTQGLSNDFKDTYKKFNWNVFRPFYDRVYKVAPEFQMTDSAGINLGNFAGFHKDGFKINIKHNFAKGSQLTCEAHNSGQWRKNNIALIVIARNARDDTTVSTLNLEVQGLGCLTYKDI